MSRRALSANNSKEKYLTKSVQYIYSPYKKKGNAYESIDHKLMSIQSGIDRLLSSINKHNPIKNKDLKSFKSILRSSSPFQDKNGSEKKIRSQQLTPKNDKKEKEFHSVAAKSFSTPFNFQQNSSKLEQSLNNEKKNSTLKECQNKIEFYQKLYDDQLKEKIILSELIESIKNEIMKNEKNHEKLKKNSKKIFQEKEKERKNLEKNESNSLYLNKEIIKVNEEIEKLQAEINEIKNMSLEIKSNYKNEEDKIKMILSLDHSLKKEILSNNKNKEKIKSNLMANNRKLHGFLDKIQIMEKEKEIFVNRLKTMVSFT